jgi:PPOX class probable FMN-dependent enzyme
MRRIEDVEALECVVGAPPLAVLMKSIPTLDEHCRAILAEAPVAIVGYRDTEGRQRAHLVGGSRGFAEPTSDSMLRLPAPPDAADGSSMSTMFLVPGWREALRINGRRSTSVPDTLEVEEALLHCGKAVMRSKLWQPGAHAADLSPDSTPTAFLAACPFVVLASHDPRSGADASPKGDPAGFIRFIDERTLAIPDRRGNRRTDTLHNLMADPRVALLALVPGSALTLEVLGEAHVTDDPTLCGEMAMSGKAPKSAIVVSVEQTALVPSAALAEAGLWDEVSRKAPDLPPAGQIWTDHVKRNDTRGLKASAIRSGANGALVQAGAELDYKRLY